MFSLSQMTKVKLVCALAWRENFAKGNNSVTDTKRRMLDSLTLHEARHGYRSEKYIARKCVSFHFQQEVWITRNAPSTGKKENAVDVLHPKILKGD